MKLFSLLAIVSSAFLSGCASTGLLLLNTSVKVSSEHKVVSDVAYGESSWQRLDLHIPTNTSSQAKPVLIFFYGGGWYSGNKEQYFFAADAFARLGYLVVVPDYIKAPKGKFPQFVEDGARAAAWVKANIAEHGGDPNSIFMAGHSAGAHLAGLLLSNASYLQQYGLVPKDFKGFAGLAGPYNFTPTERRYVKVFAPEENYPKMQIRNFVDGDEPPMILLHGLADETVGLFNKDMTIEKLKAVGVPHGDVEYLDVNHTQILLSLTPRFQHHANTLQDIHQFFMAQMR